MEHRAIHLKTWRKLFMLPATKQTPHSALDDDDKWATKVGGTTTTTTTAGELFRMAKTKMQRRERNSELVCEKQIGNGTRLDVVSSLCLLMEPNARCIRFIWIVTNHRTTSNRKEQTDKKGGSVAFVSAQSGNEIIRRERKREGEGENWARTNGSRTPAQGWTNCALTPIS